MLAWLRVEEGDPFGFKRQLILTLLMGSSVLLRLCILYFTSISETLSYRVELTNSMIGLPYIREVAFRLRHGLRPYEFGNNLPVPLLVAWFDLVSGVEGAVIVAIDTLAALFLYRIASKKFDSNSLLPIVCLAIYQFHPYNLLGTFALSSASLLHLMLFGSISHAMDGDQTVSVAFAAIATYISPYSISILAPIAASLPKNRVGLFASFAFVLLILMGASWMIAGTWNFIFSSHWSLFSFSSLRPNVGLYWYLCTEMFDFFRPFFTSFLQLHILFYAFPAFIRFKNDPLFMSFCVIAVHSLLHPLPTVSDAALYTSMIPLLPELIPHLQMLKISLVALCFTTVLAPVNWYYWIHQGSGNANFYYAITLVYNVIHVLLILDVIRTYIWQDVLQRNPQLVKSDLYQK